MASTLDKSAAADYVGSGVGCYGGLLTPIISSTRYLVRTNTGTAARIASLERQVEELKSMIAQLVERNESPYSEIVLRDIDDETAKGEIERFFLDHDGEDIDAADIQNDLGIDIWMVIPILEELESEGKIRLS